MYVTLSESGSPAQVVDRLRRKHNGDAAVQRVADAIADDIERNAADGSPVSVSVSVSVGYARKPDMF